ncbi:MAG TPA: Ppx/GppA phosphatase family protein, partial [Acidimicrobiia bacterium]
MRIAALDLGTNSFHLLVAEVHGDGGFEPLVREKEMLRLGDAVARHGRIPEVAAERAVATVRRFRLLADAAEADEIVACATSAVRGAANGDALVDRIEAETGVDVRVIDGLTEAQLIFRAIRESVLLDPAPALCFDLGGGSVEIMVGDAAGLAWAASENLGVGRLTAELVGSDPLSKDDRRHLRNRIESVLAPVAAAVARFEPRMAVGTSGTLEDLAHMVAARRREDVPASLNQLTITRDEFLPLHREIISSKASQRRRLEGLEARRVDLIPAGSMFLATAMELFDFEELTVSQWALREGILLDAIGHHDPADWSNDPRAIRRASVQGLARRCDIDVDHSRQVARLALSLFDQTSELHGLGSHDRELLEYAALLHNIGQHVATKGHHKHAAYLI